jgi:hypothetical protein
MDCDEGQIRQAVCDLDEEIKQLDLHRRRLAMIRRDLLIAIGARKPVVVKVDFMTNPDGSRTYLKKYRFDQEKPR